MRATLGRRNEGLFDEYGTEFIFTARRATTGDILMRHNVAAMDLDFTWKLKLRLSDQLGTSSPFDLRILQGTTELDDSQTLRTYVRSGLLEVEVVTQTRRTYTLRDEARIGEMAGLQQASKLWLFLANGIRAPQLLRVGRQRISPLILAINSPYLEEETREAPGVVETLLLGNCDPNELGRPEISPLTSALRIMDTEALCLLLSAANPNLTARGDHLPIFAAIARQNVPAVQALVAARANLQVRGFSMTPAQGRKEWPQMGRMGRVYSTRNGKRQRCDHKGIIIISGLGPRNQGYSGLP